MPFDPKQFDDEQIDALLRNVSVPADLKVSLRQIPRLTDESQDTIDNKNEPKRNSSPNVYTVTWMMVLAASLAALTAFAGWQIYSGQNANDEPAMVVEINRSTTNTEGEDSLELAELDQEISTLTAMLAQIEIQKMEQQLSNTETRYEAELANHEIQSIIVALADQTSLPLGGDSESVKSDMAQVIKTFPGSMRRENRSQLFRPFKQLRYPGFNSFCLRISLVHDSGLSRSRPVHYQIEPP